MSKSLVQELYDVLFTNAIINSVYNDEGYDSCETPDYDAAYEVLLKRETISPEELNATITHEEQDDWDGDTEIEFTCLDLIKKTLMGDFGDQYQKTSSQAKNFEAALNVWNATGGDPTIWEEKAELSEEEVSKLSGRQWLKSNLRMKSLAEVVGSRADDISGSNQEKALKSALPICQKLRKFKDFQNTLSEWEKNSITGYLKRLEGLEKKMKMAEIRNAIALAKKKDFKEISKMGDWQLRNATIRFLLKGFSGDDTFDGLAKISETINKAMGTETLTLD